MSKKAVLKSIVKDIRPNIVINCIGLTKHLYVRSDKKITKINSDFPHYAKKISNKFNAKFVQISTDCVFNGKKGNYHERDRPNAKDLYGISKAAGEIYDDFNLTIRTSTIGHEIKTQYGLLEWFLSIKNSCQGFSRAYFNGLPTYYLSKVLLVLLYKFDVTGLLHVSGTKINKYNLLNKINKIYNKKIIINKNSDFKIDRTLNNSKLKKYIKHIPNWNNLISGMKKNNDKK